jgi:hypothetical protein
MVWYVKRERHPHRRVGDVMLVMWVPCLRWKTLTTVTVVLLSSLPTDYQRPTNLLQMTGDE